MFIEVGEEEEDGEEDEGGVSVSTNTNAPDPAVFPAIDAGTA